MRRAALCMNVVWACLAVVLLGCNPGQCLRQSDCPLGAACKKGVCKIPPAPRKEKDAGGASPADTQGNDESTTTSGPNDSTLADASVSDASSVSTANSGQSSNLDSTSDTATTLTP